MSKPYILKGTTFDGRTPLIVAEIINKLISSEERVYLDYGYTDGDKAGQSWGETNDIKGILARTSGKYKVPLMLKNRNSDGGPTILDHCIIKITSRKHVWYKHPCYRPFDEEASDE